MKRLAPPKGGPFLDAWDTGGFPETAALRLRICWEARGSGFGFRAPPPVSAPFEGLGFRL